MIGGSPSSDFVLQINPYKYHPGQLIDLWVWNKTKKSLWFTDQSLGVRGFQYDPETHDWTEVDLGFRLMTPRPTEIPPTERPKGIFWPSTFPSFDFYAPTLSIDKPVLVRLLIQGYDDPSMSGKTYMAYADIEIVP